MIDSYIQLAQDTIALARRLGADLVSVSLGNATSFQVEVRNQTIELLKEAVSSGIHITLCKDKRRSSLTSNDLRMEAIEALVHSTLEALPYMGEDPHYTLPDPKLQGRADCDLNFVDENYSAITSAQKIERVLDLEQRTLERDSRLLSEQSYYSDLISYSVYADSNGFADGFCKTLYSLGMSVFAEDQNQEGENKQRKQTDGWYTCSRRFDLLDDNQEIANKASMRVLRKLGAIKPKSCEVPVVFSPEMARSLMSNLTSALMGDNLYRRQSFLVDKLEQKIAHENVTLEDNPLLPGKLGSRYFDSEGVKAKPLSLIEKGVLKNYMLSTYSANKMNGTTTGHSGGISNLVLKPGPYSEEELIASVKDGLYLTFMSGQGANIINGDYSRGAQGQWIRDGKLSEAVGEFTIASTMMDMLNNISMIANNPDTRSSIITPAIKIERMTVSGK